MKKISILALFFALIVFASPAAAQEMVVVLDPGHGGLDAGAVYKGLQEKNVNLDIAYRTKALLTNAGYKVYLTRTDDSYKSNNDRYTFANSVGGSVLVSIHLNSSTDHSIDGTQGFYGKKIKDEAFTRTVHKSLANNLGVADRGVRNYASGVLLKSAMPATLQETVFLSSDYEYALLADGTGNRQQQIARALFIGIENWFK